MEGARLDLTGHPIGLAAIALFAVAYVVVMGEEFLHLRKSKPVILASGLIWLLIGAVYVTSGASTEAMVHAVEDSLLEYAKLFLFLLVAMTYINTIEERGVFDAIRAWILGKGLSLRAIFWVTGALAFFISPVADNLTTALIMGAVLLAVAQGNRRVVSMGCIHIVVAANAGGAFSPFGDITTLMVWQQGILSFGAFFRLFVPSLVNWLLPAALMSAFVGNGTPNAVSERAVIREGGLGVVALFLGTITTAVLFHSVFHLPPVLGMMTGLGFLGLYGFYLRRREAKRFATSISTNVFEELSHKGAEAETFDIFKRLERAEWDTLMFFYGVVLCVGGLSTIGYLALVAEWAYGPTIGATAANVGAGLLSAVIDNIPIMFAVLEMHPDMSVGQWLLVTLTAGVGGSLLSIGSAAGVGLMGTARGQYTFFGHLKWTWAVALGYIASIVVHFWLNEALFA